MNKIYKYKKSQLQIYKYLMIKIKLFINIFIYYKKKFIIDYVFFIYNKIVYNN